MAIIDHYDQRDNEDAYGAVRRRLWWAAAAAFLVAVVVGGAERVNLLPYTDGKVGLISTSSLKTLLKSSWLDQVLVPRRAALESWSIILGLWCLAGGLTLSRLGLMKPGSNPRPLLAFLVLGILVAPALTSFTLVLLSIIASGDIPSRMDMTEEVIRSQLAWMHSMLLACAGLLASVLLSLGILALRALGRLRRPNATKNDASVPSLKPFGDAR